MTGCQKRGALVTIMIVLGLGLFLALLNGGQARPVAASSNATLIAHWRIDAGSGTFVGDSSGNAYHGQATNTTWEQADYTPSIDPHALGFNGASAYVDTADFDINNNFTISAWIRAEDANNRAIISKHTTGGSNYLVMGLYNGLYHFRIRDKTWNGPAAITGDWTHLVFTAWAEDVGPDIHTHISFYLNGQFIEQFSFITAIGQVDGGLAWSIGQDWDGGPTRTDFFKGLIDDIRIYDDQLLPSEIKALSQDFTAVCSFNDSQNATFNFAAGSGACDEIHLESGTFPAYEIETKDDLKIVGSNQNTAILDVESNDRFMNNVNWSVDIQDVTIRNGDYTGTAPGGVIYNQGAMTLTHVTLTDHHSVVDGGALYNASTGYISLIDADVHSNTGVFGGSFLNNGHAELDNVTFWNNEAAGGGAIANTSAMTLTNSLLYNNRSNNSGGGILNYGTLLLVGTEVRENSAVGQGGGIYNDDFSNFVGDATVSLSQVLSNTAGISGGGLANAGTLTLDHSTISGNEAQNHGGGIYNSTLANKLMVDASTISGNMAGRSGAGILNEKEANLFNSTISGNRLTSDGDGAGLYQGGVGVMTSLTHVTITDNAGTAPGQVHGIVSVFGDLTVYNTLVLDNGGGNENCAISDTTFTQAGNLSDDNSCSGFAVEPAAVLLPLASNGGPTQTHALPENSPARDAGEPAQCLDRDQRGILRGLSCEIGAYEFGSMNLLHLPVILR